MLSQSAFDDVLDDVAAFIGNYIDELKVTGEYDALYRQAKEFRLSAQVFDAFGDNVTQIISQDLFVTTDTDIERQFRQAEAVLKNEGVSNKYLQKTLDAGDDIEDGKIDVILFVANHDSLVNLERFAKTKFYELCDKFRRKTATLSPVLANEYNSIVRNGDAVSKYNFFLPATISMPHDVNVKEYSDHLFVDEATGTATIKLDGWEEGILREEQKRKDFVCWLRNRQRASWSLAISYDNELNETKSFFPDFLIVRHNEEGYIVDILEPHDPNQNFYLKNCITAPERLPSGGYCGLRPAASGTPTGQGATNLVSCLVVRRATPYAQPRHPTQTLKEGYFEKRKLLFLERQFSFVLLNQHQFIHQRNVFNRVILHFNCNVSIGSSPTVVLLRVCSFQL